METQNLSIDQHQHMINSFLSSGIQARLIRTAIAVYPQNLSYDFRLIPNDLIEADNLILTHQPERH